jgi:hypothetical protein
MTLLKREDPPGSGNWVTIAEVKPVLVEIDCSICGNKTRMQWTGLCDHCWEIRHRLEDHSNRKARVYFLHLLRGLLGRETR